MTNELRIGNKVFDWLNREATVVKITAGGTIGLSSNEYMEESFNLSERLCYGIPLTEEILLKCGFECVHVRNKHYSISDPNGYKDNHKISIFPTVNNQWHIAFSDTLAGYKDYIPTTKIKYLHQLQNLYFALTGKELSIKLN